MQESYAPTSVSRKITSIKAFFSFVYNRGLIPVDPAADVAYTPKPQCIPLALSPTAIETLLNAPKKKKSPTSLRDSAVMHLLLSTGIRATELPDLNIGDVDLESRTIRCKTRILSFDEKTEAAMFNYLDLARKYLVKEKDEQALFLSSIGNRLDRHGALIIINKRAKQAGLNGNVGTHTLRHSFAVNKLREGTSTRELQRLLGHTCNNTTQIYKRALRKAYDIGSGEKI